MRKLNKSCIESVRLDAFRVFTLFFIERELVDGADDSNGATIESLAAVGDSVSEKIGNDSKVEIGAVSALV
jgi:hypothetical protein